MLNIIRDDPDEAPQEEDTKEGPRPSDLNGARVAVTGRFASMSQVEFLELIEQVGGECTTTPGRKTKWLVVGSAGPPLNKEAQPTQALTRARQLAADGYEIEIIQEEAFLEKLDLSGDDEACLLYTSDAADE